LHIVRPSEDGVLAEGVAGGRRIERVVDLGTPSVLDDAEAVLDAGSPRKGKA
jgi:hypothetical protein